GAPVTLCDSPSYDLGASWGDGAIVTAPNYFGSIYRLPESGGLPEPLTRLAGQVSQGWPQILPQGGGGLFPGSATFGGENSEIDVLSFKAGATKTLLKGGYFGRFLPTGERGGHLLYIHEGTLFAVPLNLERLELTGKPAPVLADVAANGRAAQF